jgi:TPR repeat protein
MAQRFTLDRQSFEQFLAAASLVQQFQKQAARTGRTDTFAQPLLELVETQKAIDSGGMDVDSAIERIVRLALRVVGGEGTAVWLFSNEEFVYRAGSGRSASQDERLRLTVLARVAAICEPSRESFPGQREWAKGAGDSGYYPGAVRSLIVGPIYQNQTVVGALAAFSSDFDAFGQRDAGNIRLLSGLIGNAMERSFAAHTRTVVALPRQHVLRLIEQIVPTLQKLVQKEQFGTINVPSTVDAAPSEGTLAESVVLQAPAEEPVPAAKIEEIAPPAPVFELSPTLGPQNVEFAAQPLAQESPVHQQEPDLVLNTSALTDELARLSRNIAEIEHPEQIAESTAELMALSETVSSNKASVAAESPDEVLTTEAPVMQSADSDAIEQESPAEPTFSIDDTAVPGIGVRAALYDDNEEKEPSQFWPTVRQAFVNSGERFVRLFAAIAHGLGRVGSSLSNSGRSVGRHIRKAAAYRPAIPALPTQWLNGTYRQTRTAFSAATGRTRDQLRSLAQHKPQLPRISTAPMREHLRKAGASVQTSIGSTAQRLNSFVSSLPELPGFPAARAKRQLQHAQIAAAQSLKEASARANRVQNYRLRVHLNARALQRSASAFAILVVMSAFLVMESGLFRSDNTAAASARENEGRNVPVPTQTATDKTSTSHSALASATPQHESASPSSSVHPGPTSHHTITDPVAEDVVQNLTRYEVSTLRRQATSGDEEAAFQLGMAYEIGYDVAQNCSKAAEWVAKSAEAGYPAAEYNLGLRYRDGDGVAANSAESEQWLSKAAARKYHSARAALAALTAQDKPTGK